MKVQFLGHAGLLIDSGKTRLLMDAWFSSEGAFDASYTSCRRTSTSTCVHLPR